MNIKKFTMMAVTYVVLTFIIAAGWHLFLFKDMYDQLGIFTRKEPIIPLGIASMIMQALALAYLYPLFFKGGSPVKEGLKFGLLIGVLMASIAVFAEGAKQQVSSLTTWLIFESVYYLLQFSLVGLAIGLIYGRSANRG